MDKMSKNHAYFEEMEIRQIDLLEKIVTELKQSRSLRYRIDDIQTRLQKLASRKARLQNVTKYSKSAQTSPTVTNTSLFDFLIFIFLFHFYLKVVAFFVLF